ncbi:vacuolar protein sorting-associated protein 51 homolog isoform X1 [Portunus trituberculatus]|uniref:vacuolar protein sorting-associated protein 51 homolog isoform X1 n=1 Tax=Portunus trituberculatus TaxID=210409 RepID=UPI001E1D1CD5|nr:vacuolar protein sorting-associated protein 51 homolog isoform X1 [Portunus trituberculatus]
MQKRPRRTELLHFYNEGMKEETPYDINSKHFNCDMYVQKTIKESSLKQLLEHESELVSEIQSLDSDCQTLVYDHYDKFIAAADIVRKMKEGSVSMEAQITRLQENMGRITASSTSITSALQERRGHLSRLLGVHGTLKKLEFLFHLPQKIDECIAEKNFSEGVRSYVETAEVLHRYRHMPSFDAIHCDCEAAVGRLNAALKEQLALKEGSARHLTECVDLLLQLGEPAAGLCDDFLSHARTKLEDDLATLTRLAEAAAEVEQDGGTSHETEAGEGAEEVKEVSQEELIVSVLGKTVPMDILEFVDICHETFVGNLWLVISSYKEMFLRSPDEGGRSSTLALEKLRTFVAGLVDQYVAVVGVRVAAEPDTAHYAPLTTALDKFHRRLHAITQLLPNTSFGDTALGLVIEAGQARCSSSLAALKVGLATNLGDVRHALAAPRHLTQDGTESTHRQLNEHLTRLVAATAASIKERVTALQAFTQPKHTFAVKAEFRHQFCRELVREGVVVAFFLHLTDMMMEFCHKKDKDPVLLLLLSRMCLDLHTSTVHYLLSHCDEQLQLEDKSGLTSLHTITDGMKEAGQRLLNHYVHTQGAAISQMLRRSVELKDWLGCGEPRSVRRVMRTVLEEISTIDTQVGALYEEGSHRDRSSDSSRRTYHSVSASRGAGGRSAWSSYTPSQLDNSLVANLNKLWSERIEIFAPVEFTRLSILTGIVKISLKTLLESVRLRTFSRFGLQQVQVDAHYLRTYLWSYVADEHVLNVLLDEVVTSASVRCCEPELMEQRVVEFICDQS